MGGLKMDLHLLIKKSNEGDEKAREEILEYFGPMINKIVKTTYIAGCDKDDIHQIAIIVILKAIKKIDLSKYQSVEGYVYSALKNYFYTQRARAINMGICLSLNYQDDEEGEDELIDRLAGDCNVEEQYMLKEDIRMIRNLMKNLSEEERDFLIEIYSCGYGGIREYSKTHNKPYMYCYRLKERLLKKLRKSMETL